MNRQVIEIVDELVKVAAGIRRGSLWLHVDEESTKVAWRIGKMPSSSPVDLQRAPLPGTPAISV
jgi:hypothetical protein